MGLTERFITRPEDVFEVLALGSLNKAVAETRQNQRSSRSHTLLALELEQIYPSKTVKFSKINLIDLAGSERIGKTGAEG
mmetsp:Transcript_9821/g.5130  ORF Transcript_9821/g.5130 Transcript_9821/m.5130 type:complete len:80 (+) Transcript_9821:370-609(+)